MNTRNIVVPALLGALLISAGAQAAGINSRQDEQRERIQQGVRSGELTRREAFRLRTREARTRRLEARARRSGGRLTFAERQQLQRRLNANSRAIYHQKHDGQDNDRREDRRDRND